MTDHSNASIRPPKDWQDFERNTRILFECILNDITVQNNGRAGQSQNGVDIYGRKDGRGSEWFGIQCKGKDINFGGEVTESELRLEVEKSRNFKPTISYFILVTTAPVDVKIQAVARKIIEERELEGNPLNVAVWGWGELENRISLYPRALQAFEPDAFPHTNQILADTSYIRSQVDFLVQEVQSSKHLIKTGYDTSAEVEILDKFIHSEIDKYRDLLKEGKSRTALQLLEKLRNEIWGSASDRIKFRLITNIGSANFELSNKKEAISCFLEAITYQPEDKIALANLALAYLLQNDTVKAIDAARKALLKDEANAEAASYLIQAHIFDESLNDPQELVSSVLSGTASVDIAVINFYRTRNDKKWVGVAKEALHRNPENEQIIRFAAEAELEIALSARRLTCIQTLQATTNIEEIKKASQILKILWDKQCSSEYPASDASLPHNLAQLYRIMDEKVLASTVVAQAMEKMPEDVNLMKLQVSFLLSNNETNEAITVLKKLNNDAESRLLYTEILSKKDPVAAIEILKDFKSTKDLEEFHVILAASIRIDSWLTHPILSKHEKIDNAIKEYNVIKELYPNHVLVSLIHSEILEYSDQEEAMNEEIKQALLVLDESTDYYERYLIAQRLEKLNRYSDIADVLDGYVNASFDSPPLRTLYYSLINSDRRSQALAFLSEMPKEVSEKPDILRATIKLHLRRGDYIAADLAIGKLLILQPKNLHIHLNRIDIWLRQRNETAIKEFLATRVEGLEGLPEERMRLAHLLDRYEHYERALALGYKMFLENSRNHDIYLAYIGLLLKPNSSKAIDLTRTIVNEDTAFVLRNHSNLNKIETFVIEQDESLRLHEDAVAETNPYAKAALGHAEGETISIPNKGDWEIISIKHKYVHLLHITMEKFERLFPESGELKCVDLKKENGDLSLEPIFKTIKDKHDYTNSVIDMYEESYLPLQLYTKLLGVDVIESWCGLVQSRRKFKVCHGNTPERNAAFNAIKDNNKAGCITDALTLHLIRMFEIEEIIVELCGSIAVTQSTKDTFRYRIERAQSNGEKSYMTMYWHDGQYYKDEITVEQIQQNLEFQTQNYEWIEQKIEILVAESDQPFPKEMEQIKAVLSHDFFDAILAAQGNSRLLLCEDQAYRQIGVTAFNLKGTWLQPVLTLAVTKGLLSREKYCRIICELVKLGHSFTSIDISILHYAMKIGNHEFQAVTKALFDKDAEVISHQRVMIEFFVDIWRTAEDSSLSKKMATSTLLHRYFYGEWKQNFDNLKLKDMLAVFSQLNNSNLLGYLKGWLTGHFHLEEIFASKENFHTTKKKRRNHKKVIRKQ